MTPNELLRVFATESAANDIAEGLDAAFIRECEVEGFVEAQEDLKPHHNHPLPKIHTIF